MTPRIMARLTPLLPLLALCVAVGIVGFERHRAAELAAETVRTEREIARLERALPPNAVSRPADDDEH